MYNVTSFSASDVPPDELQGILADYLALDRARLYRRLLLVRCGLLACAAAAIGLFVHGFSVMARAGSVALCLAPPAWAWVVELRLASRLSKRLPPEKVIKSP